MSTKPIALPTEAEMIAQLAKRHDDDVGRYLIRNNFVRMNYGNTAQAGAGLHKRFTPDERVQFLACYQEWDKAGYYGPLMKPESDSEVVAGKLKPALGPDDGDDCLLHELVIEYLSARNETYVMADPIGAIPCGLEFLGGTDLEGFMTAFKAA